jgi:regulator of extracellular matrix RemA (YlzA/DUF370 family)
MSLHLGNDIVISSKQLLAILNLQNLKESSGLLKMLDSRRCTERLRSIGKGRCVSAILCNKGTMYLSPIDANTLARRAMHGHHLGRTMEKKRGGQSEG